MLRSVILAAARSPRVERLVETAPVSRDVVRRFVAGTGTDDALRATRELVDDGLAVTLDHLGEDTLTPEQADGHPRRVPRACSAALADGRADPGGRGQRQALRARPAFDEKLAYDHARAICAAAAEAGTTVTLDMEDHTTTDSTLEILGRLREDFPTTGAVLQAYLRRTEARLPGAGRRRARGCGCARAPTRSRSRWPTSPRLDVDKSYVRCLNILMSGEGYPMLATHDPRLIAIGEDRASWFDRSPDDVRVPDALRHPPPEQERLAAEGYTVRVYVPYGTEWYGYLMRRLAERPAVLGRALPAG